MELLFNHPQKEKEVNKATEPGQRLRTFNMDILSQTSMYGYVNDL